MQNFSQKICINERSSKLRPYSKVFVLDYRFILTVHIIFTHLFPGSFRIYYFFTFQVLNCHHWKIFFNVLLRPIPERSSSRSRSPQRSHEGKITPTGEPFGKFRDRNFYGDTQLVSGHFLRCSSVWGESNNILYLTKKYKNSATYMFQVWK